MNFKRIDRDHLARCANVFIQVFNNPPWNEKWEAQAVTKRLQDCYETPGFIGLSVEIDAVIVGFALGYTEQWDKSRHFYLKEMCVISAQQRRGVGAALMGALEENLKADGVEKLYLYTARDTFAQSFYEKQGFRASARILMMTKHLSAD